MILARPLAVATSGVAASVDGRRFLWAIACAISAAGLTGTAAWFAFRGLMPSIESAVVTQIVVAVVYVTLIAIFGYAFRPVHELPINLRFTSARHLGLAVLALLGLIGAAVLVYLLLTPVTGGLIESTRQILSVATDAKRLNGQPAAAWVLAITRGCLIAPIFEEVFFRGLLIGWLRKRLANRSAIAVSAALFAAMHGYPIVIPYAFLFGLVTGWVRVQTGSTLNTIVMHVLDNVLFLLIGLFFLR